MTQFLHTQADLEAALAQLIAADPRLAPVARKGRRLQPAPARGRLSRPCAIVCGQQLSTAAAATIRNRLFAAFDPFHHDTVRRARADKLKRLGLSAPKIKSIREIGKAVAKGRIDLERVGNMDADAAHAALTALHGVGPWTADIYLLFCLGHADAFPAGDLAVQESARLAFSLRKRPDAQGAQQTSRGLAALARRGGASAVGLLSCGEAARGHFSQAGGASQEAREDVDESEKENEKKENQEWLNSTARAFRRAQGPPNTSSCSCTVTAPTATT